MVSQTLKRLRSDKQNKWRKYTRSRNIVTYAEYKSAANKFKSEFLKSKCDYEKLLFISQNSNSKFFKYVKSQSEARYGIPCIKKSDGTFAISDYEKACEFLTYFSSVFVKDNNVLPDFPIQCNDSLQTFTCSVQDILKTVRKLKSNSAPGPDGITAYFFKSVLANIVNPLCTLFNKSLSGGCLPNDWKIAYITPIFKKGDAQYTSQYRPISLTSVLCKILERIIRDQLLDYINKNDILPKEQHGFRPKKSTLSNLIECLNDWTLNFDNGICTNVIYLDYAKCFDSVCHSKLLYKLKKYGISGLALDWISNFLCNRTQHVKINSSVSSAAIVESGVPQGTVLGPLLFLIYSADLPKVIKHSKLSMYADDTKLYKTISNNNDFMLLQEGLNEILVWANSWQMKLNPEKNKNVTNW